MTVETYKLLKGTLGTGYFISITLLIRNLRSGEVKGHFHGDGLAGGPAKPRSLISGLPSSAFFCSPSAACSG